MPLQERAAASRKSKAAQFGMSISKWIADQRAVVRSRASSHFGTRKEFPVTLDFRKIRANR